MKNLFKALGIVTLLLTTGCPTFQDEYTGQYREVPTEERMQCFESRQCNLFSIDFFRFGDFAQAVIREYGKGLRNTGETPFVEESECVWTRADRFGESTQAFSLPIKQQAVRAGVLSGHVTDDGLVVEVFEPDDNLGGNQEQVVQTLELELMENDARPSCNSINDYLVYANLGASFPASEPFRIEHPVFVLVWLGLERFESLGSVVYLPTQGPSTWWRLPTGVISDGGAALDGRINGIQVPPPEEKYLSVSGNTRFSIAHLIVVDDRESEGRFNWSLSDEPIVASAVRQGSPREEFAGLNEPSHGSAVFFVEDSLMDLDPALQERIVNLEDHEHVEQHYYLVDFVADGEEIVEIRLPEKLIPESPSLRVTTEYLNSTRIELPRLFPFNTQ